MDGTKSTAKSKIIVTNAVTGVIALAFVLGLDLGLSAEDQTRLVTGIMLFTNVVTIIWRRFFTSKSLGGGNA